MEKKYPFSVEKHAHDIELYHNRLYNTLYEMEVGEIPMNREEYDRLSDLYYGELQGLYDMMFQSHDGRVVYLTGKQICLAKEIVAWAAEARANSLLKAGKGPYIQYL